MQDAKLFGLKIIIYLKEKKEWDTIKQLGPSLPKLSFQLRDSPLRRTQAHWYSASHHSMKTAAVNE